MLLFAMTVNAIWPLRANGTVSLTGKFRGDTVKEFVKQRGEGGGAWNNGSQLLVALGGAGRGEDAFS